MHRGSLPNSLPAEVSQLDVCLWRLTGSPETLAGVSYVNSWIHRHTAVPETLAAAGEFHASRRQQWNWMHRGSLPNSLPAEVSQLDVCLWRITGSPGTLAGASYVNSWIHRHTAVPETLAAAGEFHASRVCGTKPDPTHCLAHKLSGDGKTLAAARELDASRLFAELLTGGAAAGELHVARLFGEVLTGGGLTASCMPLANHWLAWNLSGGLRQQGNWMLRGSLPNSLPAEVSQLDVCLWRITGSPGTLAGASYVNSWIHRHTAMPETLAAAGEFHASRRQQGNWMHRGSLPNSLPAEVSQLDVCLWRITGSPGTLAGVSGELHVARLFGEVLTGGGLTASCMPLANHWLAWNLSGGLPGFLAKSLPAEVSQLHVCLWRITGSPETLAGVSGELHVARLFGEVLTGGGLTASCMPLANHWLAWNLSGGLRQQGNWMHRGSLPNSLPAEVSQLDVCLWRLTGSPETLAGVSYVNSWIHRHTAVPETLAAAGEFHASRRQQWNWMHRGSLPNSLPAEVSQLDVCLWRITGSPGTLAGASYVNSWIHRHTAMPETLAAAGEFHASRRQQWNWMHRGSLPNSLPAEVSQLDVCLWRITGSPGTLAGASYVNSWIHRHTAMPETLAAAGEFHASRRQQWNWMHRGSLPNSLPAEVSQLDVCLWRITGSPGTLAGASYVNSWIHRHTAVPETLAAAGEFHASRRQQGNWMHRGSLPNSLPAEVSQLDVCLWRITGSPGTLAGVSGELHVARLFGEVLTGGGLTASCMPLANHWLAWNLSGGLPGFLAKSLPAEVSQLHVCLWRITGSPETLAGVSYVNSWIHRHTAVPETLAAAGELHVARLFGEVLTGGGLTASCMPLATHWLASNLSGGLRQQGNWMHRGSLPNSLPAEVSQLDVCLWRLTGSPETLAGVSYVNSWIHRHTAVPETLAAAGEFHASRRQQWNWMHRGSLPNSLPAEVSQLDVCLWRITGSAGTLAGASYVNSWIHRHTAMPETLAAAGEFHASRVCGTKPDPTHCLAHKLSGDGKTLAAARELDASRLFAELLTGGGFLAKSLPAEVSQLHVCLWRITGSPETLAGVSGELHVARLFGEVLTGGGLTASCMPLANHWLAWNLSGGLRQQGNWMHRGSLPNSLPAEVSQLDVCLWRLTGSPETLAGVSYVNSWIHRHTAVPETLAAAGEFHASRRQQWNWMHRGSLPNSLPAEVSQLDVCLWRITGSPGTLAGASYVNSWIHRHTAMPETLAAAGEFHASRRQQWNWMHRGSLPNSLPAEVSQLDVCLWRITGSPGTLAGASYVNSWIHRHTAMPETLAAAGEFHASRRQQWNWMHRGSLPNSLPAEVSQLDVCLWRITGSPGTLAGASYVNSWIHRHTAVPETLAAAGEFHASRRQQGNWMHRGSLPNSLPAEVSQLDVCLWRITGSPGTLAGVSGELHVARLFGEVLTGGGLTASCMPLANHWLAWNLSGGLPGFLAKSLPAEVSQLHVCLWRITGSPETLAGVSYVNSWIHRHTAVPETLAAAGELHVARLFGEVLTGGGLTASCMPLATHWLASNLSGGLRQQGNWMHRGSLPNSLPAEVSQLDVCLWRLTGSPETLAGVSYVNSWIHRHTAVPETLAAAGEFHASRRQQWNWMHRGSLPNSLPAEVSQLDVCLWRITGSAGTLAGASYVNSWIHRHTAMPETLAAAGEFHASRRQQGNWMLRGSLPNSLPAEVSQLDVCLWRITGSPGTLAGVSYVNSWIHRHTAVPETLAAAGELHVARLFGEVLTGGGLTASCMPLANHWLAWNLSGGLRQQGNWMHRGSLPNSLPAEVSQLDVCLWRITGSPGTLAGVSYVNSWIHRHTAVPETLAAAGELHVARLFGEVLTGGGLTASCMPLANHWLAWNLSGGLVPAAGELHVARLFGEVLTGGGLTASCMPLANHWLAWNLSGGLRQQGNWMLRGSLPNSLPAEVSQLDVCLWRITGSPGTLAGVSYVNSWIHRHTAVPETLAAAGELHVARLFGEVLTGGGLTASCMPLANHWLASNLSGGLRQQGNWMHRGSLPNSLPAEVSQLDVCLWRLTGSPETLAGVSYVNSWIHRHTAVPETLAAAGEFHASRVCGTKPDPTHCLAHKLSGDGKTLAAARELDASRLFAELLTGGAAAGELHVARLFGEVLTGGGLTASCMPLANHWLAWNLSGGLVLPETLAAAGEFHASRVCGTKPDPTHCLAHKLSGDGKTLAAARELDASRLFAELLTGGGLTASSGASYVNSWIHRHTAVPETLAAAGELHVARLFGELLTGGGLTASCMPLANHWLAWNLSGGLRQQGNWMLRGSLPNSLPAEVSQLDVCLWRITGSPETLAGVSGELHVARLFGEVLTGGGLTASCMPLANHWLAWNLSGGLRQQWNWMHRGSLPNSLPAEVSQLDVCLWRITGSPGTLAGASYVNSWIHRHTAVPETLAAAGELHASRRQQWNWMHRGSLPNSLPAEVSQLDVCLWRITGSPGTLAGASYVNSWIHRHTAMPETLAAAGEFHASRVCGTKPDPTHCLAHKLSGDGKTLAAARELDASRLFAELLTGGGFLAKSLPAEVSQLDVCLWRLTGSPGTLAGASYVNSWIHRHTAMPETLAAAGEFHASRVCGTKPDPTHCLAHKLSGDGKTLAEAGELHVARLFGEVLTGGGLTASLPETLAAAGELHASRRQQWNWMHRGSLPNSLPAEVSQLDVCLWRITGSPGTLAGASYVNSWIHRHTAMPETLAAAGEFHASRVCGTKPDPTHCLAHKLSGDGKTLAAARELDASRLFAELLTGGVPETLAAAGEFHSSRRQQGNWMLRGSLPNSLPAEVSQLDVCLWRITGSPGTLAGVSYVNSWIHRHTAVPETLAAAGELHVARLFAEVLTGGGLTASCFLAKSLPAEVSQLDVCLWRITGSPGTLAGASYVNSWIHRHTAVPETLAAAGEFHASRRQQGNWMHRGSLPNSLPAEVSQLDVCLWRITGSPGTLAGVSYVNSWIHRHTAVPETLAAAGEFHASRVCGTKPDPTHCLAHKLSGDGKTLAAARELDASRLFAELLTGGAGVSYVNSWIHRHTAVPETLAAAGEFHSSRRQQGNWMLRGSLPNSLPAEVSQLDVCLWRITGSPGTLAGVSYVNSWIHRHTAVPETLAAAGELHVARLFAEVLTGGGLTASCFLAKSLPAEVSQLDVCLWQITGSPGTLAGASYVNSWIHRHTAVPETLAAAGEFHASRVCGTKPDPTHCLAHKLSGDGKTLAAGMELDASRLFAELLTGGGLTASCMPLANHWLAWNLSGGLRQQGNWMHRGSLPNSLPAEVSQLDVCLWRLTGSPGTLAGVSYVNSWIHRHTAVPETLAAAGEFHSSRRQQGNWMLRGSLPNSLPAEVSQLDVCLWRITGSPGTLAGVSYVNSWIHRHTAVPETLAAAGELHVARLFAEVLTGGGLTASCFLAKSLPAEVSQLDVCLWQITGSPGTLAGASYVNSWIHRHTAVPETLAAAGEFHASRVCGTKPDPTHCLAHKLSGDGKTLAAGMELDASRLFAELLTGGGLTASLPETLAAAGEFHASRVCGTKPDPTHCLAHKLSGDGKTLAAARELDASRLFAELLTGGAGVSYVNSWIHRHTAVPETLAAAGEFHSSRRQQGNWMLRGSLPNSLPAEVSQLDVCLWRITGSPGTLAGVSYVNSWIHRHTAVPETLAAAGEFHASRRQQGNWMHRGSLPNSLPAEVSQLDVCLWRITGSPGTLAGVSYVNSWIYQHTAVPETLAAAGELHVARLFGEVLTGGGLTASSGVSYVNSWIHRHTAVPETLAAAGELHVARLFGEVLTGGGLTASCMPLATHWLAWNRSGGLPGFLAKSLPAEVSQLHVCLWRITGSPETLAGVSYVNSWIHRHTAVPETLAAAGELHVARLFGEVLTGGGLTASCFLAKSLPAEVSQLHVCLWRITGSPETLAGVSGELHVARLFGEVLTGGGLTASCMPLANHWLAWNLSGGLRQQWNWMHRGSLPNSLPAEVSQLDVCLWRLTGSPETLAGVSYVNSWIYQHTAVPETLAAAGEFHASRRQQGNWMHRGSLPNSLPAEVSQLDVCLWRITGSPGTLAGVSYVNSWIYQHTAVPETLAAAGELHVARLFGEVLTGGGLTASSGVSYVNSWIHRHTAVPETLAAAGELHVARLFGEVLTGGGLTASCMPLATHWLAWNRSGGLPGFLAKSLPAEVSQLDVCLWRITGSPETLAGGLRQQGNWMHRGSLPNSLPAEVSQLDVCLWRLTGSPGTLAGASYVNSWIHRHTAVPETLAAAGEFHASRRQQWNWMHRGSLPNSLPAEVSQLDVCLWRITGSPGTLAGVSYVNSWIHRHTAVPETLAAAGELHVARLFGEVLTGGGLTASSGVSYVNSWIYQHTAVPETLAAAGELHVARLFGEVLTGGGLTASSGVSYVNSWIHRHTAVPETLAAAGELHVARLFGEVLTGGGLTASCMPLATHWLAWNRSGGLPGFLAKSLPAEVSQLHVCLWRITGSPETLAGVSYVNSWIHRHTAVPETLAAAGELHVARLFGEVLTGGGLTASSLAAAGELHVARLFGEVLLANSLPAEVSQLDVCLWRITGSPETLAGASYVNSWIHRHTAVPETLAAAGELHVARLFGEVLTGGGLTASSGASYVNSWIHRHTAVPETLAAAGELHVARLFGKVLTGGGLTASCFLAKSLPAEVSQLHVCLWRITGSPETLAGASYVNSWIHRHTAVPETLAAAGEFHASRVCGTKPDPTHCLAHKLSGDGKTLAAARELDASRLFAELLTGGGFLAKSLPAEVSQLHVCLWRITGSPETLAGVSYVNSWIHRHTAVPETLAAAGELHVARLFGEVLTGGGLTASCFLAKSLPAEVSQLHVCLWRITGSPETLAGASYVNSWIHRHTAVPETLAAAGEFHASRVCGTKPDPTHCLAHKLSGDGKTLAAARELDASRLFAELLTGGVPETLAAAGELHVARLFGEVLTGGGLTASSAAGELHVARLFGEVLTGGGLTASSAAGELHVARLFGEVLTGGGLTASCMPLATHWLASNLSGGLVSLAAAGELHVARLFGEVLLANSLPAEVSQLDVCLWRITGSPETLAGVSYVNSWIHRHTAVPETLAAAGELHVARLFGEVLTGGGLTASSGASYVNSWIHRHTAMPETLAAAGEFHASRLCGTKPDPTHCLAQKLSGDGKTLAAVRELDAPRLFAERLTGGGLTAYCSLRNLGRRQFLFPKTDDFDRFPSRVRPVQIILLQYFTSAATAAGDATSDPRLESSV
ncbi:hypothetical protein DFH06DRAFT_1402718 [Mycena polygramma]|nr:hypothetical protein DFH06DRAFT_1402718 [Mycena polygramma]